MQCRMIYKTRFLPGFLVFGVQTLPAISIAIRAKPE